MTDGERALFNLHVACATSGEGVVRRAVGEGGRRGRRIFVERSDTRAALVSHVVSLGLARAETHVQGRETILLFNVLMF